ncbi:MAG: FecR domain-containing protein, partial [Armatimonadetes bacterium]|nr:FecR domain-containing protein [Armatimonadota bacterium]
ACVAALLSPYGYGLAIAGALFVGLLLGAVNGYLSGRTRISSAMVTVMTGAVALQLTMYATSRLDLTMASPELQAVGETNVGGIPVILSLFIVALLGSRLLLNQEAFAPVGSAPTRVQAVALASPQNVMLAFLVSGLLAGLAGLLISSASMAIIGPAGQMVWMLTPLAAALIGGGSVTTGNGNLRTAAIGAASIALINWLVNQLRMPIAGPVAEAPWLVIGLLADRWQNMTAYMIGQARRGNLLALPEDMQVPMVVRVWRQTSWPVRIGGAVGMLALFAAVYVYVAFYVVGRVPEGTAIVSEVTGTVQVAHRGIGGLQVATPGEKLQPGDLVVTGRASQAFLRFHDGSEMRLYQNSELLIQNLEALESGGMTTALRVNVGAFFTKVRKMMTRQSSFSVQTPLLTLGVRGTAFQLEIGQEQGAVAVNEGAVSIKRAVKVDEGFGLARWAEDERTVEAGKRANAGETTLVENMTKQESDRLAATEKDLLQRSREKRLEALQTRAPKGLWVFIIIGYLIFIAILKPEPHMYIADVMAKRADYFTSRHTRSAADSPRSATLAQMHIRAGNWDEARVEIQSIIENDPNSEYGAWAQRFWMEMEKERRRRGG